MKVTIVIILLIAFQCISSSINTTSFWSSQLKSELHFQAYTGYEQINWYYPKGTSGMYYQLFGAMGATLNQANTSIPLFICLHGGGPGVSSSLGAYVELGPIRITDGKPKLATNPWNLFGHNLFIDQPLNVGFSYHGQRHAQEQVSTTKDAVKHLMNFISNFYNSWPNLRGNPLYITGESFAGHYIPVLTKSILENDTFRAQTKISIKGLIVGEGHTDPINQINYFDSLLYSAGIVSNKFRDVINWYQTSSILKIYEGNFKQSTKFYDEIVSNETSKNYLGGMSFLNIKNYQDNIDTFGAFLQANKASLGVPKDVQFIFNNLEIQTAFEADISVSYANEMAFCLDKLKVLIYNGQNDFVVNTSGVLQYLNSLNWNGVNNWKNADKQIWKIDGEIVGWVKNYGNLWFGLVNKAGHLVPFDQPKSAFSIVGHFINNDRNWNQ